MSTHYAMSLYGSGWLLAVRSPYLPVGRFLHVCPGLTHLRLEPAEQLKILLPAIRFQGASDGAEMNSSLILHT